MTFRAPGFRTIIPVVMGFALIKLSGSIELQGDLSVDPGPRLAYHLSALVVLIGALACFIWALKAIFFDKRTPTPASGSQPADTKPEKTIQYVDIYPKESQFDADAALARYMRSRGEPDSRDAPAVKSGGFGRKGL